MSGHSIITQEAAACDCGSFDPEGEVWNGRNAHQGGGGKMLGRRSGQVGEAGRPKMVGRVGPGCTFGKSTSSFRSSLSCCEPLFSAQMPIPSPRAEVPLE